MENGIILKSNGLRLALSLTVFESDIKYPCNTTMSVSVESCGFTGSADMDIDVKELAAFAAQVADIYASLKGCALIQEPYGHRQLLKLEGDGKGHILLCGMIKSANALTQELRFENLVDQTELKAFSTELTAACSKYITE